MKRLSEQQILEIINKYQSGETPLNIAQEFGILGNSIARILRKRNVKRNQLEKVSQDNINKIIEQYNFGVSSEIIADNLNISGSTVCRILKKNSVDIRPSEDNKLKYKIDQSYFENIDTEEKAYYLGFLYADANLTKNDSHRHCIKLTLHSQDRDVTDGLSKIIYGFINVNSEFKDYGDKVTEYCTLNIYSKKMHTDLQKWGCFPCKSFTIEFKKDMLPPKLVKHFIRGFFDGDGCICLTNNSRPIIDITSNKEFLEKLQEYLEDLLNIKFNKISQRHKDRDNNTRNLQLTSFRGVKIFLDYLYDDASVFMIRKKKYYENFLKLTQFKRQTKINKITNLSNYGTSYIPSYKDNIINSEYIKTTTPEEKLDITEFLLPLYRDRGFPYYELSEDELIKDFNILKDFDVNTINKDKNLTIFNMAGLSIFKHFAPHFFEVKSGIESHKPSMFEAFNNDNCLKKVIMNRLNQNYSMSGNMLRQGLCNSNVAFKASIFFPTIAKFIYSKFAKDNDIIYDYSMGFGQRLLAALSLPFKVKYIGVDPFVKSVESNNNIFNFFSTHVPGLNKEAEMLCNVSENYCDPKYIGKINLAFSSPAYFNQEIYDRNINQACHEKSYTQFINEWWRKTTHNIHSLLQDNGYFILNVKDKVSGFNLSEDMNNVAKETGFTLVDTYYIQLSKNLSFRNKDSKHKLEPIYVFKK